MAKHTLKILRCDGKIFKVCLAILQHYVERVNRAQKKFFTFCFKYLATLCKECIAVVAVGAGGAFGLPLFSKEKF